MFFFPSSFFLSLTLFLALVLACCMGGKSNPKSSEYLDDLRHLELRYDNAQECFLRSISEQKLSYWSTRQKITMKVKINRIKTNFILVSVFLSKVTYLQLLVVSCKKRHQYLHLTMKIDIEKSNALKNLLKVRTEHTVGYQGSTCKKVMVTDSIIMFAIFIPDRVPILTSSNNASKFFFYSAGLGADRNYIFL